MLARGGGRNPTGCFYSKHSLAVLTLLFGAWVLDGLNLASLCIHPCVCYVSLGKVPAFVKREKIGGLIVMEISCFGLVCVSPLVQRPSFPVGNK